MTKKKKAPAKKKTTVRKSRVEKTRNANSMTEAGFWVFIRSALRQKSRWWLPIKKTKEAARRPYKGVNKLQKWEYQCNTCKGWFKEKEIAVDHIVECGELRCAEDLAGFVERLFAEEGAFQVLCDACHNTKTQEYRKSKKKYNGLI